MKFKIKSLLVALCLPIFAVAQTLDLDVVAGSPRSSSAGPLPINFTVTNNQSTAVGGGVLRASLPEGFRYLNNSGRRNGAEQEPRISVSQIEFDVGALAAGERVEFTVVAAGSAAATPGTYQIEARVFNALGQALSDRAVAKQVLRTAPSFDCSDIIGKVFNDTNINGHQDEGEEGLANVRLAAVQGLEVTTDAHGRFHITCPQLAHVQRGSNFILKVDTRTLPAGFRMTTENPRVKRITRGRVTKMNFGAAVHRVVRLDLANGAFVPARRELSRESTSGLSELIETLKAQPSVLRVAYRADKESESLANNRLRWVRASVERLWRAEHCCYDLEVETELYWRGGAAPAQGALVELQN